MTIISHTYFMNEEKLLCVKELLIRVKSRTLTFNYLVSIGWMLDLMIFKLLKSNYLN